MVTIEGTLQIKTGLEIDRTFTPSLGEPIWVTDEEKLYIGDGSTVGGILASGGGNTYAAQSGGGLELNGTTNEFFIAATAGGKYLYSIAADTWTEGTITAAGRALLDDNSAADQRTTLGLPTTYAYVSLSNLSSVAINTTLLPASNDGAGLGSGTYSFSDLFLASGGVINWNNGNVTLTHSTDTLSLTGNLSVGTTTSYTKLTVLDTSASSPRGISSMQISDDTNGARVEFSKARGTVSVPTIVVTGDTLGQLMFRGYDGSNYLEMASIGVGASGTVASTRVPTYITFSTATDAAPSVLTERMRITNAGYVGIGTTTPGSTLEVVGQSRITTGNELRLYNVANDRYVTFYNNNSLIIQTTGSNADIYLMTNRSFSVGANVDISSASYFSYIYSYNNSYGLSSSNSEQSWFAVLPRIEQTGTANYNALLVDVTEATTGSGVNALMNLRVGGTSKMIVTNAGYVGIGTTNPSYILDVNGIANFRSSVYIPSGSVVGYSSSIGNIRFSDSGQGGFGMLTFSGCNNVGYSFTKTIYQFTGSTFTTNGASSSNYKGLDLGYTINFSGGIQTGTLTGIYMDVTETNLNGVTHDLMNLLVGGNSKVIVKNSGYVGIGTTSPIQLLHVVGGSGSPRIMVEKTDASGGDAVFKMKTLNSEWGFFGYGASNNFSIYDYAGGYRLTINSSGYVGISTTAPTNILSLGGTAARTIWMERNTTAATAGQGLTLHSGGAYTGGTDLAGGDLTLSSGISTGSGSSSIHFYTATAGAAGETDRTPTEKMTILGSGYVGIGTTNPAYALEVSAAGTGIKSYFGDGTNRVYIYTSSSLGEIGTRNNIPFSFATNYVTRMTIGTSGNVGIGTTNPTTTLYVTGTATVTTSINSSRYDVGGGVALSTISTTLYIANYSSWTKVAFCYGDVGIGVLSPTAVLHLKAGTAAANTAPLKFTSGPINTSAEVGTQEYNGVFHQTKYGSIRYTLGGILNSQYTSVSNAGAGEDDLHTYTVLRDTLSSDGSLIEFVFTLSFAANANSKQVRSYLGSTKIYDSTAQVQSGGVMIISGIIIRTGATGQIVIINTTNTAAVPLFSSGASYVIGTETLANDLVLKTTAEAVNDADATQLSSTVKYGGY